jgi:cytochrome c-type biogenesis protein CcsB
MALSNITFFWLAFWSYLIAMILYTYRIATGNTITERIGKALLWLGFIALTIGSIMRGFEIGHMPLTGLYEYVVIFAWAIVGAYLLFDRWLKLPVSGGAFAAFMGFLIIAIASLLPKEASNQLVPALQSYWLNIHVTIAVLGEGAFFVAFLAALLYLIKQYEPENKESSLSSMRFGLWSISLLAGGVIWGAILKLTTIQLPESGLVRILIFIAAMFLFALPFVWILIKLQPKLRAELPDLVKLDTLSYRAVTLGYPLFTFGALIAGAIWAHKAWGTFWSWDPKEVGSALVWFVFTIYLHARYQRDWKGNRAAILAICGFLLTILTLMGNLVLGGLHSYGVPA